jgi:ABC-type uncharacterized transport system ATPase subunit
VILSEGHAVWSGSAQELHGQAPSSAHSVVTSDDARAQEIAAGLPGVALEHSPEGGLLVRAGQGELDQLVLALGRAGVAVRRLELLESPLASIFFSLTGRPAPEANGDAGGQP